MWKYEKRLQYPVKISRPDPTLAQYIISQYGGPDGEMGASMRYLSQRFSMPYKIAKGTLTDIGTEESKCSSQLSGLAVRRRQPMAVYGQIPGSSASGSFMLISSFIKRTGPPVFCACP